MRFLVSLASHLSNPPQPQIVQVLPALSEGDSCVVNGLYSFEMPEKFNLRVGDVLLDAGGSLQGGDLVSRGFSTLLKSFPQYQSIYINPLLTSDHVAELVVDPNSSTQSEFFTDPDTGDVFKPRFQTGREQGVADDGQMPTHTALLPRNTKTSTTRPGLLITAPISLGREASSFVVNWFLHGFEVSHDIATSEGLYSGTNTPALRSFVQKTKAPTGFSAYISTEGGASWKSIDPLAPITGCVPSDTIQLAFRNDSDDKLFINSFQVLF